jgi:hypothetical protein
LYLGVNLVAPTQFEIKSTQNIFLFCGELIAVVSNEETSYLRRLFTKVLVCNTLNLGTVDIPSVLFLIKFSQAFTIIISQICVLLYPQSIISMSEEF